MKIHDLKIETVQLAAIHQHPDNPNNGDMDALEESMEVNGFFAPITLQRSTGAILAGNHRYMVALRRGMKELPAIYLDVTDEQAKRIMLADNQITRLGFDDEGQLLNALTDLYATDLSLHGTGFDMDDLRKLEKDINEPLDLPVDADVDSRMGEDGPSKAMRFTVTPGMCDEDGNVYELIIEKRGMVAISKGDANTVRRALGLDPFTEEELMAFTGLAWK